MIMAAQGFVEEEESQRRLVLVDVRARGRVVLTEVTEREFADEGEAAPGGNESSAGAVLEEGGGKKRRGRKVASQPSVTESSVLGELEGESGADGQAGAEVRGAALDSLFTDEPLPAAGRAKKVGRKAKRKGGAEAVREACSLHVKGLDHFDLVRSAARKAAKTRAKESVEMLAGAQSREAAAGC
jgi:hypothetical protein